MKLTPEQRAAALAYITGTIDDEMLASFVWQVNFMGDASPIINEISALHCDAVVANSSAFVNDPNEMRRENAQHNVAAYGAHAVRLRSRKFSAAATDPCEDDMDGEALMPGDPGYDAAERKADLYHDMSKES